MCATSPKKFLAPPKIKFSVNDLQCSSGDEFTYASVSMRKPSHAAPYEVYDLLSTLSNSGNWKKQLSFVRDVVNNERRQFAGTIFEDEMCIVYSLLASQSYAYGTKKLMSRMQHGGRCEFRDTWHECVPLCFLLAAYLDSCVLFDSLPFNSLNFFFQQ